MIIEMLFIALVALALYIFRDQLMTKYFGLVPSGVLHKLIKSWLDCQIWFALWFATCAVVLTLI